MIIITPDIIGQKEIELIHSIPWNDKLILHLRSSVYQKNVIADILSDMDHSIYPFLVIHNHIDLLYEQPLLNRIHLSEYKSACIAQIPAEITWTISTSVHDISTFNGLDQRFSYAFISPVYPSISKKGYKQTTDFKMENIRKRTNYCTQLIALGGINDQNICELTMMGYDDVALCGHLWQAPVPQDTLTNLHIMQHAGYRKNHITNA
jgi:thiamine-phosphate pyrophosphorylase